MTQEQRRNFLIEYLLAERPGDEPSIPIPARDAEQRSMLRGLLNVRPPVPAEDAFLHIQDAYLKEELRLKGITDYHEAEQLGKHIYLWQGDITTLRCDAIVNAANSRLTGCWQPNHRCIDNCIHTFAGIQLRQECAALMEQQGTPEPVGCAKITKAYNLPCKYVIHTVGPVVDGPLTKEHRRLLASCYTTCLRLAEKHDVGSIAFCSISTGVFGFPKFDAAAVAVKTVIDYLSRQHSANVPDVIFNVFSEEDYINYWNIL